MTRTILLVLFLAGLAAAVTLAYRRINLDRVHFREGRVLEAQGRTDEAAVRYETAWRAGLRDPLLYERLIRRYHAQSNFTAAARLSREAADAAPPGPEPATEPLPAWRARWDLARALGYARLHDESLREYDRLLAERPHLLQARIERAQVLLWSGRQDEALDAFLALPEDALDPSAFLALADLLTACGEYALAEDLYASRLLADPADRTARRKLADVLSWQRRYPESLAEFERLLAQRPDDVSLRRQYANVLIWAGRHAEAADQLRQTLPEARTP
jgi:tetratricopeptide (TPR) repeat protein